MDLRVQLSSCVPATHLETSGARLEAEDLLPLKRPSQGDRPGRVHELSRASSHSDPGVLAKLRPSQAAISTAIAPLLRGYDLNAYIAAGIRTDHEATTAEEAREKLRKGMRILVREGSVSKTSTRCRRS